MTESNHPEARAFFYFTLGVLHDSRNLFDLATCATERGIGLAGPECDREAYFDLLTTKVVIQRYKGDRSRAGLTIGRVRVLSQDAELARVEHNIARLMLADDEVKKTENHPKFALGPCEEHANLLVLPYTKEALGACYLGLEDFDSVEAAFVAGPGIAIEVCDFRA